MRTRLTSSLFSLNILLFAITIAAQDNGLFQIWDSKAKFSPTNHMLEHNVKPLDSVRIAVIGLGNRGQMALERLPKIVGVQIKAISDIDSSKVNQSAERYFLNDNLKVPDLYYGSSDWKSISERDDIDLIYVCTHWELHTPIAVYAMNHGKHVAVEVPAALTIKECWELVKTAEKTKKHCIQLENCMYDFFEISVHNMAKKGLFGELVHTEGAYIHDLRALNFSDTYYWNHWRLKRLQKTNGNTYPTHGLGPLAHILNIHRGDKMERLVSMSSNQFGLTQYANSNLSNQSGWQGNQFQKGDMNITLIKTNRGKTIMLQHDVTSPRPYSRLFTVSGTNGFVQKYPVKGMAFEPNAHRSMDVEQLSDTLLKYEPKPIKNIKDRAKEIGGHGGMDYIMDYRLIYCLRNGLPLDQDVYDAAEWSAVIALSKKSIKKNSKGVKFPDFTRGKWDKLKKVSYYVN